MTSYIVNVASAKLPLAFTFILTFFLASHMAAGESKDKTAREQTSFCEEGAPDDLALKLVPLPKVVLTSVMNTKEGREAREDARKKGRELDPEKILMGAKVHLTDSPEVFFFVMGSYPMSGADNTWFWIVRQSGKSATILLWAGGNCLDVESTRTLGYRDIVTTWSSASTTETNTYRYNGKSYKLRRRKSGPATWK